MILTVKNRLSRRIDFPENIDRLQINRIGSAEKTIRRTSIIRKYKNFVSMGRIYDDSAK